MIGQKIVKTRKQQMCWGCCGIIETGSSALHNVTVDEYGFLSSYWCTTCQVIIGNIGQYDKNEGFAEGELKENNIDAWNEAHENTIR